MGETVQPLNLNSEVNENNIMTELFSLEKKGPIKTKDLSLFKRGPKLLTLLLKQKRVVKSHTRRSIHQARQTRQKKYQKYNSTPYRKAHNLSKGTSAWKGH